MWSWKNVQIGPHQYVHTWRAITVKNSFSTGSTVEKAISREIRYGARRDFFPSDQSVLFFFFGSIILEWNVAELKWNIQTTKKYYTLATMLSSSASVRRTFRFTWETFIHNDF